MTSTETVTYPFGTAVNLELDPAYAKARDTPGLLRIQLPYGEPAWLATRYEDVRLVMGDRRFSRAMAVEADVPRMTPTKLDAGIIVQDPPDHTRLRRLVAMAFTQRRVERLRARIRELSEQLVDDMVALGMPVDLVEHFALSLPVAVICELLGVPVGDRPKFRVWSDAFLSTNEATAAQFTATREAFRAYMSGLVAERRAAPADDLMTALIEARDEHDRLSELELVDMCSGILIAGHETTASHIPNFVITLLDHPARLAELRANLDLAPAAVEELTRFVPLGYGPGFPGTPPRTWWWAGFSCAPGNRWWWTSARPTETPAGSTIPTSSVSTGPTTSTSASATAPTTASAPNWPGSSSRKDYAPWSTGCPACTSPATSTGRSKCRYADHAGCRSAGSGLQELPARIVVR
ncbi:hypothetical protein GCM10029964_064630 [Kibdelosporangium lantanae]